MRGGEIAPLAERDRDREGGEKKKRVIIQVQSFIIKCLSFRRVSFVQGYRLCIEKLCT